MVQTMIRETKTLLLPRLVSYYFPFQGAECGILWGERQIPSSLHSLVGVTLLLWREEVRFRSLLITNS